MHVRVLAAVALLSVSCGNEAPASSSASAAAPAASAKPSATASAHFAEMAPPLRVGDSAPDVTLTLADGQKVPLSREKGKLVLVYFYPQDETKGCTIEAESIRDSQRDFESAGIEVYGVSMQGAESHKEFAEKHSLKFPLVVDEDGAVATAFHVPHDEKHDKRQSFLIGKDGKIIAEWLDVDPTKHAADVLAAAAKAGPLVVEVKPNGDVLFGGEKVDKTTDIVAKAKEAAAKNPEVGVSVVASPSVPQGKVLDVMDRLKEGGIKKLSMVVPPAASASASASAGPAAPPR